jgi:hypothetical protein
MHYLLFYEVGETSSRSALNIGQSNRQRSFCSKVHHRR